MSTTHRIAVIPGDGIGTEVVPEGLRVLDAAASAFDLKLDYEHFDHSSADYYLKHGKMLPDNWFEELSGFDAIFFGAVGWPDVVPDHISLWGSLLQFRRALRPVRQPAAGAADARRAQPAGRPRTRRRRLLRRPGEHRRRILQRRRQDLRRHRPRNRDAGNGHDPHRRRPHPQVRLRPRADPPEEAPHLGHQEQRHLDHDALLGRTRRRRWPPTTPTSTWTSTTSTS